MNYLVKKYKIKNGKILIKKFEINLIEADANFLMDKNLILTTSLQLGLKEITDEEKYQMIADNSSKRKSKINPKKEMELLRQAVNDIILGLNNNVDIVKYLVQQINNKELSYEDVIYKRPDLKDEIDELL